jgi:hypothetical protein
MTMTKSLFELCVWSSSRFFMLMVIVVRTFIHFVVNFTWWSKNDLKWVFFWWFFVCFSLSRFRQLLIFDVVEMSAVYWNSLRSRFLHIFTIPQIPNSSRIWSLLVLLISTFSEIFIISLTWWNLCQTMTNFITFLWRFLSWYASHDSSFARCSQLFNESLKTPENL